MDPTLPIVIVAACANLVARLLRVHARARYVRRQHRTLLALAARLPSTMVVELADLAGDGTRLRLRTATATDPRERDARA